MQFAILAQSPQEMSQTDRIHPRYFLSRVRVSIRPRFFLYAKKGGFSELLDVVRSFVRATAVLAAKRAERHDHARSRTTTHGHARQRMTTHDNARQRTTTHDNARQRTTTHDRARPRTTAHDRPRLPYLFEEAVPTPPQGGLGG